MPGRAKHMNWPTLNWKEIGLLCESFRDQLEGLFVERIIVPERPRFEPGYLKGESAIRLTGRRNEGTLLFSIRPRHPYLVFTPGKGPRAAAQATRSPFDQEISKYLKGQRLLALEHLPRERTVILWLSDPDARDSRTRSRIGLVLTLIPAAPEALLIRDPGQAPPWPILTRSRPPKNQTRAETDYTPPDGSKAPDSPPVRDELVSDGVSFLKVIESGLEREAFELRFTRALRELRELARQAETRIQQSETALAEALSDQDWQKYGDLLKAVLHDPPGMQYRFQGKEKEAYRLLPDFLAELHTPPLLEIPMDPKLSPSEQVEKFYQLSRRRNRRITEAKARIATLQESLARLRERISQAPPLTSASADQNRAPALDWKGLERLERSANRVPAGTSGPAPAAPKSRKGAWLGKTFVSKDGLSIWVGRSRDENLELTFKHARGNDLWLHVRGRPGAHVVIPLQPGKSAPLETLLDAATLAIYYSGGEKWGKTEVDYAFKKNVKRIKDSTEASYVHNKTLIIEPDAARIQRLLSESS